MSDLWERLNCDEKENDSSSNISDTIPIEEQEPKPAAPAAAVAPSPNTMRKRRRADIARRVESRKALITTQCTSRLDMTKVQSMLSGPRLSWDWQSGPGARNDADDLDDDSCGLIVDFHQDSRSALKTHISKAMSQMASRDISSQSVPTAPSKSSTDDIRQIIQMKRRMITSQATQINSKESELETVEEEPPVLEPILEPDYIHAWQETQMPPLSSDSVIEPTQVFVHPHVSQPTPPVVEEEIEMEPEVFESTQVYVAESTQVYVAEPTQVYLPAPPAAPPRELKEQLSKASSIPPNSERDDVDSESEGDSEDSDSESDSDSETSSESAAEISSPVALPKLAPKPTSQREVSPGASKGTSKRELNFKEWLEQRNKVKLLRKKRSKMTEGAKGFFEAEAEESEDEELAGIVRRQKADASSNDEASSEDEDSDLEDLVASAKDEFDLLTKAGAKDSSRLAKLHAKWQDERDEQLEKAIEGKDFWKRKGLRGLQGMEDEAAGGLNRMQRKLKARQDAIGQQFDANGNALAPEYASDSDYDSMEIDSDDFFDENSDPEDRQLDQEELAARRQRKEREKERRRRDLELKLEMKNRRALLKAKLKEELAMKEKDTREIQAGLGIMPEEDREAFKLVNRTQGGFGYTQTSGITTQSTSASVSSQSSPAFSFLAKSGIHEVKFRSRRSSVGALDLE